MERDRERVVCPQNRQEMKHGAGADILGCPTPASDFCSNWKCFLKRLEIWWKKQKRKNVKVENCPLRLSSFNLFSKFALFDLFTSPGKWHADATHHVRGGLRSPRGDRTWCDVVVTVPAQACKATRAWASPCNITAPLYWAHFRYIKLGEHFLIILKTNLEGRYY